MFQITLHRTKLKQDILKNFETTIIPVTIVISMEESGNQLVIHQFLQACSLGQV